MIASTGNRDSGFGIRDWAFGIGHSGFKADFPNPESRIPNPESGPLSVIVYSWTVDHAVGLLFAMEELAW